MLGPLLLGPVLYPGYIRLLGPVVGWGGGALWGPQLRLLDSRGPRLRAPGAPQF